MCSVLQCLFVFKHRSVRPVRTVTVHQLANSYSNSNTNFGSDYTAIPLPHACNHTRPNKHADNRAYSCPHFFQRIDPHIGVCRI
jgi:hypothetical protein